MEMKKPRQTAGFFHCLDAAGGTAVAVAIRVSRLLFYVGIGAMGLMTYGAETREAE